MASRSNVNVNVSEDNDDIDDIPDEISANTEETHTTTPATNGASTAAGMSLDDFKELGFNDEQDELERKKLDAPTGDWEKNDRWKVEKKVYEGDCMPGDIDATGRTVLRVTGKPKPRTANDIEYEPTLFISLSPDKRYKRDKPNEVDNAYKLFLHSKDLYLAINQERIKNMSQLIAMLEEDEYLVRTMNGDNGPVPVGIKAKVQKRR